MRIRKGSNGQRTDIPLLHTSPTIALAGFLLEVAQAASYY